MRGIIVLKTASHMNIQRLGETNLVHRVEKKKCPEFDNLKLGDIVKFDLSDAKPQNVSPSVRQFIAALEHPTTLE